MSEETKPKIGTVGQKFATGAMLWAIKRLANPVLIKEIFELVQAYMNIDGLTGSEKKERVKEELADVKRESAKFLESFAGFLLDTAIGIVHAYIAVRLTKD